MYLPGDLTISKAIQNDMLGTVRVPTTVHIESASRTLPRPSRATFPSHTLGMSREKGD
jgi:hypothetical protein